MNELNKHLKGIKYQPGKETISEKEMEKHPFYQFEKWFADALKSEPDRANAFVLSTSTKDGMPSARVVLLKGLEKNGFVFFTNYDSRKGKELLDNPNASMTFYWHELERQVRVEGTVQKISEGESDEYFSTRAAGSKAGAWISPQSKVIEGREELEKNHRDFLIDYTGKEIQRPPFWGGFCIVPTRIEFWQGRVSRLHDRILYSLEKGNWKIERLAP